MLKKIPYLRELYYIAIVGWRAFADWFDEKIGRKPYAVRDLENLFAGKVDPWNFGASLQEKERFDNAWALVPPKPYRRILEIGCAEGHFTEQIAKRYAIEIIATDFMPLALERARRRCAAFPHVRFQKMDIAKDDLKGEFDLIFCMGVLEYGPAVIGQLDKICQKITSALAPDGCLILDSQRAVPAFENRWWARRFCWGARAIHDRFLKSGQMTLVAENCSFGGERMTSLLQKNYVQRS